MKIHLYPGFIILCISVITFSCGSNLEKSLPNNHTKSTQKQPIGGACETCELMYVDIPSNINSVDTSAAWSKAGQKLIVHGKVYKNNGASLASDIIIYYWHTDVSGRYSSDENMNPKAARHGHIRGWVKTNENGEYTLYTIRPAAYPEGSEPEHIHLLVKEPDVANEYYIDDIVFSDDPLLEKVIKRRTMNNRGGSGIVNIEKEGELQIVEHKVVLGMNIPGY